MDVDIRGRQPHVSLCEIDTHSLGLLPCGGGTLTSTRRAARSKVATCGWLMREPLMAEFGVKRHGAVQAPADGGGRPPQPGRCAA